MKPSWFKPGRSAALRASGPWMVLAGLALALSMGIAAGASLSGTFTSIASGSVVNLTSEGELDWVHWGLHNETSLNRKSGVAPQISDFTPVDASNGFVFVYQFADNANGYSWSDGTPTAAETNTTTGVWAYGTPLINSGFQIRVPADTGTRTLKVYVGAFAARGRLVARLSDDSAAEYTSSALFNILNGPSGVYTLTYAAASPGQEIIVQWTLQMPTRPQGNVTLQAAALTSLTANNPPFVTLTSPQENASFSAGASVTLTANARDLDGNVAGVEFFQGVTRLGEDKTDPYQFTWNNVAAGRYVLTARATDDGGAAFISSPVEIFVNGTGGTLTGNLNVPPNLAAAVNLTTQGTADWVHWGYGSNAVVDRKASVAAQIDNFAVIGSDAVERYADNFTGYSWSDGAPTGSVNDTHTGVFVYGAGSGFEFTVPADTTSRTLRVYAGLYAAEGSFQAWLSDFSAPAYASTLSSETANAYGLFTITFASASAGKTLHVRYRAAHLFDQDYGNVTLQAATLSGLAVTNEPPQAVTLLAPHWQGNDFIFSFASRSGAAYAVQFTPELAPADWQLLTSLTGNGSLLTVSNRNSTALRRFYRVQSQ